MKKLLLVALGALVVMAGCATAPTVESRKKERPGAYASLPDDQRQLVDQGQIKVGMNMEAVYLAWGKASQELRSESEAGGAVTWLYEGAWMDEYRYWGYRHLHTIYQPRTFVRAEVVFVNGIVKSWRTLPQPAY
jgi:hypothetical protein